MNCLFNSTAQKVVFQNNPSSTANSNISQLQIKKIEVLDHTAFGIVDGKIVITIKDLNPTNSTYIVSYAVHSSDNIFTSKELTSDNDQLTLNNVIAGDYFSVKVTRVVDNKSNIINATFNLKSASPTIGDLNSSRTQTLCTSPITYTNCSNTLTTVSNLYTETSYNVEASTIPCGIDIGTSCNVVRANRWHCIQGNLSVPPLQNSYTKTNFTGVNLTALQACRIKYVICNNFSTIGNINTTNAIWFITGTGGANNALVAAAVAAVPVPNGNETLMIFYKSDNASYQNMVDWTCDDAVALGNTVWNDLNNNGIKDSGESGIAAVQVYLFKDFNYDGIGDNSNNPDAITTTDVNGNYSFTNLAAGGYFIRISTPVGYLIGNVPASGTTPNNDVDNDNNLSIGIQSSTITLSVGGEPTTDGDGTNGNNTLDVGLFNPFNNCYNSQGLDDFATTATIVPLLGRTSPTVVSASYTNAGSYGGFMTNTLTGKNSFGGTNLASGAVPGSFSVATGAGDSVSAVMIWDGDNNPALNPTGLGCKNLSAFQTLDFIYSDDRQSGTVETFELTLYSSAGAASKVTYTYVAPGNGIAQLVSIPFSSLVALSGFTPVNLSCIGAIKLKADILNTTNNNGWDFEFSRMQFCTKAAPGSLGDYVWEDSNGDGIQNNGEAGIVNAEVILTNSNGTIFGKTFTDINGIYLFANLVPNDYIVVFNTPIGYNRTLSNQSSLIIVLDIWGNPIDQLDPDALDSDPINGIVNNVQVLSNQMNGTIDAGFQIISLLPVKFTNLTATKVNQTSVLNFSIAQASLASTFYIERSINGVNFNSIGVVNSNSFTSYNYTDIMPIQNAKNYYRIKEIDAQGKSTISEIKVVQFSNNIKVEVYPMPASNTLNIGFSETYTNKPITISLLNNIGQVIFHKKIVKSNEHEVLDISKLTNGTYQLNIIDDNNIIANRKILIIK
jgi:SdrD B-like domain/Secretion system C-terminal sorting domain